MGGSRRTAPEKVLQAYAGGSEDVVATSPELEHFHDCASAGGRSGKCLISKHTCARIFRRWESQARARPRSWRNLRSNSTRVTSARYAAVSIQNKHGRRSEIMRAPGANWVRSCGPQLTSVRWRLQSQRR